MNPATRHIWNVRLGPCFCGVRPGADGSFDLHRWQVSHATSHELDISVLVATTEVPHQVAAEIQRRVVPDRHDWMVIEHRLCPYARRSGAVQSGVPLRSLLTSDRTLDVCVSDRPDQLIVALLDRGTRHAKPELRSLAGV
jgi:hypothetical protein